jgi:FkbH-like protein
MTPTDELRRNLGTLSVDAKRRLTELLRRHSTIPASSMTLDECNHFITISVANGLRLPPEALQMGKSALDYGMDSIAHMHWINACKKRWRVDLSPTDLPLNAALSNWAKTLHARFTIAESIIEQASGNGSDRSQLEVSRTPLYLERIIGCASFKDRHIDTAHADLHNVLGDVLGAGIALRAGSDGLTARFVAGHDRSRAFAQLESFGCALSQYLGDRELYPSLAVQRRYWLIAEMTKHRSLYTNVVGVCIDGDISAERVRDICYELVSKEKAFRVTLKKVSRLVAQEVRAVEGVFDFKYLSIADAVKDPASFIKKSVAEDASIDKEQGPCVKFRLYRVAVNKFQFVVIADHIVSDAFSLLNLLHIIQNNMTLPEGQYSLPPSWATLSYCDRALLPGSAITREPDKSFWFRYLTGAPYNTPLPAASSRNQWTPPFAGATAATELDASVTESVHQFARQHKLTPFTFMVAVIQILLYSWTKETDLVVGLPLQRQQDDYDGELLGDYTNTVPLRSFVSPDEPSMTLIDRVALGLAEVRAHSDLPFEDIANLLTKRAEFENPLFNVMVNQLPAYCKFDSVESASKWSLWENVNPTATAKMPLMFLWTISESNISIFCEYRLGLVDDVTARELLEKAREIVNVLVTSPATTPRELAEHLSKRALSAEQEQTIVVNSANRLCIAATFTADPVVIPLKYWMKLLRSNGEIELAPYGQVLQQFLSPSSDFAKCTHGYHVALLRFEDLSISTVENGFHELLEAAIAFSHQHKCSVALIVCEPSPQWESVGSNAEIARSIAAHAKRRLANSPSVSLTLPECIRTMYPTTTCHDADRYELGRIPYTSDYFYSLATVIGRQMFRAHGNRSKVIVVDCDNTLWRGILGEDGMDRLEITPSHLRFQRRLIELQEAGLLLCLCSKNDEADVLKLFASRVDMALTLDRVIAMKTNWKLKSENIQELAAELDLGLDRFVFIDDDAVQCMEVFATHPEVAVFQFPRLPHLIDRFVSHNWMLDIPQCITSEDRNRTGLYRDNILRDNFRRQVASFKDFLDGLKLDVIVNTPTPEELQRVAQLTERTNQFNASARRLSVQDIVNHQAMGGHCLSVNVRDKFGDYGLTGAVLYRIVGETCEVSDFMLSCRVLGRGVEHEVVRRVASRAAEQGATRLNIDYAITSRNAPFRHFVDDQLVPDTTKAVGNTGNRSEFGILRLMCVQMVHREAEIFDDRRATDGAAVAEMSGLPAESFCRIWRAGASAPSLPPTVVLHDALLSRIERDLDRCLVPAFYAAGQAELLAMHEFTPDDLDYYSRRSGDRNPLHIEAKYAEATGFGRRVVFGMLTVEAALKHVEGELKWDNCQIDVEFVAPLFPTVAYALVRRESPRQTIQLEFRDGDRTLTRIRVSECKEEDIERDRQDRTEDVPPVTRVGPRASPNTQDWLNIGDSRIEGRYEMGFSEKWWQLGFGGLRYSRLARLLQLTSYVVGMEAPGKQALFSRCTLSADLSRLELCSGIDFSIPSIEIDEVSGAFRYRLYLSQLQNSMAKIHISTFLRPAHDEVEDIALPKFIGVDSQLNGKNVMITGASRGLGAALALDLARRGCTVFANYQSSETAVVKIVNVAKGLPGRILFFRAGMSQFADYVAEECERHNCRLDYIIVNAALPPLQLCPTAQNRDSFRHYLVSSLKYIDGIIPSLLSIIERFTATLVYISSVFVEDKDLATGPCFAYAHSKQMMEDWVKQLVSVQPHLRAVIVRPGKMRTGMATITKLSWANATSPNAVADRIVELLGTINPALGHWEMRSVAAESIGSPVSAITANQQPTHLGDNVGTIVSGAWTDALGASHKSSSQDDDFFQAGGTSMALVEFLALLRKKLNIQLSFTDLPKQLTLKNVIQMLDGSDTAIGIPPNSLSSESPAMSLGAKAYEVAIVGLNFRVPNASSLATLWDVIRSGRSQTLPMPPQRASILAGQSDATEKTESRAYVGAFLENIDRFDAEFFQIAAIEAQRLAPHIRLILESTWSAIEDSGFSLTEFRRKRTSVFVAANIDSYKMLMADGLSESLLDHDFALRIQGMTTNIAANYVSHALDLKGTSECVNTTCSSFLVALHRAIEEIVHGQTQQAIVAAANIVGNLFDFTALDRMGLLSKHPHVLSFSKSADGTLIGEGIGSLVIKPLSLARSDGSHIYGVIKGSAVFHGGRNVSPMAPNFQAQAEAMRGAYTRAGLQLSDVGYMEVHGMGNRFADSSELAALNDFAATSLMPRQAIRLSTSKPIFGHLMEASGLLSIVKVLAAIRAKSIPGMMGAEELQLPDGVDTSAFEFREECAPWVVLKAMGGRASPRRASINSFGLTSVCAHVVVEEYVERELGGNVSKNPASTRPLVIPLSASDEAGLVRLASRVFERLSQDTRLRIEDIAFTLQMGREALRFRVAFVIYDTLELVEKLSAFLRKEKVGYFYGGDARDDVSKEVVEAADAHEAARAWVSGSDVVWSLAAHWDSEKPHQRISLPTYPFLGKRHWMPSNRTSPGSVQPPKLPLYSEILDMLSQKIISQSQATMFIQTFMASGSTSPMEQKK